jgi:hypothetical protein
MQRILRFKINPRNHFLIVVCAILDWFQDSKRFCAFADTQRNTLWTEKSSTNFVFVVVQYLISRFRKIRALQTCKEYLGLEINPNFFSFEVLLFDFKRVERFVLIFAICCCAILDFKTQKDFVLCRYARNTLRSKLIQESF